MDSLELPFDLIWEGKPEPLSPSQLALANAEDVLIFDNDFDNDLAFSDDHHLKTEHCDYEDDACNRAALEILRELQQHALETTEDLDDEANLWLNQSMNLPSMGLYVDELAPRSGVQQPIKVEQTAQLIREFDSVFEGLELTHLTPPQTPPHSPSQSPPPTSNFAFNHIRKPHEFIFPSQQYVTVPPPPSTIIPISTPPTSNYYVFDGATPAASPISQDIAHEMEVVEELVRARAENLADWTDEDDDDENSSQSASLSSASCSPRSESSYGESSNFSNDDEWSPVRVAKPTKAAMTAGVDKSASSKRRTRPYGRSSEDKKSRKKEQNKNAATRYRQKKKAEIEVALDEERELLDIQSSLETKCSDVQREIKYLKSLMRDLYKAKGNL